MRRALVAGLCVLVFAGFAVCFAAEEAKKPSSPPKEGAGIPGQALTAEQMAKYRDLMAMRQKIVNRIAGQDEEYKKIQAQIDDLQAKLKDLNKQKEARIKALSSQFANDPEWQDFQKKLEEFKATLPPPPPAPEKK